jgi:PAS domain-containing protein
VGTRDIRIRTFPSRDREFAAFARTSWGLDSAGLSQEELQRALRVRYPAAIVRAQSDLARHGDGPTIWYVFRTANLGVAPIDDEPEARTAAEAEDAWAILDDDRIFLEISPALAAIAELPGDHMVGQQVEDFSNPNDPSVRDDIIRLWSQFLVHRSIASTLRFNYEDGRPRELAYRLVADAGGAGRHRLTVRVLPPPTEAVDR